MDNVVCRYRIDSVRGRIKRRCPRVVVVEKNFSLVHPERLRCADCQSGIVQNDRRLVASFGFNSCIDEQPIGHPLVDGADRFPVLFIKNSRADFNHFRKELRAAVKSNFIFSGLLKQLARSDLKL